MTRSTVKNILFVLVSLILLVAYLYTCNEIEVYRHSLEAEARANGAQFAIIMQGAALGYLFNISAQDGVMLYLLFMSAMVIPCGILVFGVMNLKEEYDNKKEAAKRQAKQIRKAEPIGAEVAEVCNIMRAAAHTIGAELQSFTPSNAVITEAVEQIKKAERLYTALLNGWEPLHTTRAERLAVNRARLAYSMVTDNKYMQKFNAPCWLSYVREPKQYGELWND